MFKAGVDVILDCVGAPYLQRNLDSLNIDGRLFIIGFQGGVVTEVNLGCLLARRLTVQGMIILAPPSLDSEIVLNFTKQLNHCSVCIDPDTS